MEKVQRKIVLDNLLRRGTIYENVTEFADSFFCDVYKQATKMIEIIVNDNRKIKDGKNVCSKRKLDVANTISFIGRRGTGKTSAMLSYAEALKRHWGCNLSGVYENPLGFSCTSIMEEVEFLVLDCIDASTLEQSENIFKLFLANMINQLEDSFQESSESVGQYTKRDLSQKLENIFDDFITLRDNKQVVDEYSSFEKLKNIASSQKLRKSFAELVREYLQYVLDRNQKEKYSRKEKYLVIVIDDLDMSHYNFIKNDTSECSVKLNNKSYEIMRSLDQYFSVPGVIVLAAYNHENLYRQCVEFFARKPCKIEDSLSFIENGKMASRYMEKVLPPILRIYMPSWKKRDYTDTELTYIDLGVSNSSETVDTLSHLHTTNKTDISIKKFVLLLYGKLLNIYYDCEGKKKHFLEPDTLRELVTTTQMFLLSDTYDENNAIGKHIDKKQQLYKKVKDDLYFRFIQEKLIKTTENRLFSKWMEMSIDRRCEDIVTLLSKNTVPLGKQNKKLINYYETYIEAQLVRGDNYQGAFEYSDRILKRLKNNSNVKYSYAELVHSIYHMTRDEKMYSKELVECILHSYTILLSKMFEEYREEKIKWGKKNYLRWCKSSKTNSQNKLTDIYMIFKNIIGETICGKWTEYYYPEVIGCIPGVPAEVHNRNVGVIVGYHENVEMQYIIEKDINLDSNSVINIEDEIKQIIFVSMLYLDILDWSEDIPLIDFDIVKDGNLNYKLKIELNHSDNHCDFELTGFLKYTFLYPDYLRKLEGFFAKAIKIFQNKSSDKPEIVHFINQLSRNINNVFEKIWYAFIKWDFKFGNAMLPIYNLDITYNLIKRIYLETKKQNNFCVDLVSEIKAKEVFFEQFNIMLQRFTKHLDIIDKFYYNSQNKVNLRKTFESCPYIQIVHEINQMKNTNIVKYINGLVRTIEEDMRDSESADEK